MWTLISVVTVASLLGSMHCACMCGPLAFWAGGTGEATSQLQQRIATSLYHFGRMTTYVTIGLIAGSVGQLVDVGAGSMGLQLAAARLVGVMMVTLGLYHLLKYWKIRLPLPKWLQRRVDFSHPSTVAKWLVQLRPYIFRLSLPARGFATGLLTAFLPCGWLYLFALFAAGTGSAVSGGVAMFAFWLGTVPILVGLVSGSRILSTRMPVAAPILTGLLLVFGGVYTGLGRGFANLSSLHTQTATGPNTPSLARQESAARGLHTSIILDSSDSQAASTATLSEQLNRLTKQPLPCCLEHHTTPEPQNEEETQ